MAESIKNSLRSGVLLANLGTPDAPARREVAGFLREFLSDPRVVDLPRYLWLPLLYLVITPLRAGRSAAAYRKIWLPEGSPLLVLTRSLADCLARSLDGTAMVEIGMRYGKPSIKHGLESLRAAGVEKLTIIPLYPQYSGTTTASIYDAVDEALLRMEWRPDLQRVQDYHDRDAWVAAVADSIRQFRQANGQAERLIFSMHGIPQRYVAAGDPYEEQCRKSVSAIANTLGLGEDEWLLTYQSRVGREPWLQPYTDMTLKSLAESGVKHVQVVCPGFAVDCLETLEEIAMQNSELFVKSGGEKLTYIPALNGTEEHAHVLRQMLTSPAD
jgi:ferrochelatase